MKFNSIIKVTAKFRGYCEKMQFTTVKLTTDIKYARGENRFFREREPILLATPLAKTLDSWKVSRMEILKLIPPCDLLPPFARVTFLRK